jgi:hypothetical protein
MKQNQKAQDELSSRPQTLPLPHVVPDGETHRGQNGIQLLDGHVPGAGDPRRAPPGQPAPWTPGWRLGGLLIVAFAAFAYSVKGVLRGTAQERGGKATARSCCRGTQAPQLDMAGWTWCQVQVGLLDSRVSFFFSFIVHMCMQGLVHFSPLPPPPPLPPTPPPPSPPPQYPAETILPLFLILL